MKIGIGNDHSALDLKKVVVEHLQSEGYEVVDYGTYTKESCNYPEYAEPCCRAVVAGKADLGILICGTGIGMSIAANKHKGIRAALCGDPASAELTRQHNNANVLCMGARIISFEKAVEITDAFLGAEFLGGRHQRRVDMLESL